MYFEYTPQGDFTILPCKVAHLPTEQAQEGIVSLNILLAPGLAFSIDSNVTLNEETI